jgi:hypothetical protein
METTSRSQLAPMSTERNRVVVGVDDVPAERKPGLESRRLYYLIPQ